jgi:signal peptidase II
MIFIIILPILFFDQLTKSIISKKLALNESVPVIKGLFHLTLVHNRGAAFGIMKNQAALFILASVFAIVLIISNFRKKNQKDNFLYNFSLILVLSGALGNLIDRIAFGYVIDFLDFRVWPVFNIADSAITVGALLLGCQILFLDNKRSVK